MLTVWIGGPTTTATLNVTRVGYSAPLSLSATIQASGITATFNPPSLSGSTLTSTLTVSAAADATPGQVGVFTTAMGADSTSGYLLIPLNIGRAQVNVSRTGTGTGTVTSTPAGINCGSACNFAFPYGTNVTLTATPAAGSAFAGWAGGGCSGTGTTCNVVVTATPIISASFNTTAPGFTLGVTPTTATVPQGGTGRATVSITRANGFAGPIALSVTGTPSGLAITPNPQSVTDNTATLDMTASSSVAVGNYPLTLTATSAGVPSQTVSFNAQVTPAPGGSSNVAFSFLKCDPSETPIWFAAQNGTGAWTRVMPGPNSTFTYSAGASSGVAVVIPNRAGFGTTVVYGSRDEIISLALGDLCGGLHESTGTNRLTGTLSGTLNPLAVVAVGGASTELALPQGSSFSLDGAPAGRRDLIAAATFINANGTKGISRLILRRDVSYSSSIPQLNFNAPEAVITTGRPIMVNNRGSDVSSVAVSFVTTNGSTGPYLEGPGGPAGNVNYAGVPDSLLRPSDLHAISIVAAPANGGPFRFAILLHHTAVGDTVAFGPPLNQPTITTLGTGSLHRLRAQVASQTEYGAAATASFSQNANSVGVTTTAGYSGGRPPNWTLEIPDLASAGYDPAWGLRTGLPVDSEVVAVDGGLITFLGATPVDGQRVFGAGVSSNTSGASNQLLHVNRW